MNLTCFPVSTTNIFPLSNSKAGGQLFTEFNARSRESVATDSSVEYMIGPSYTHSNRDFLITSQRDGSTDATISSTVIQVSPGRALVNGHYVESLSTINVDLAVANYQLRQESSASLKGRLSIGLIMVYNNYNTVAGTAKVENEDDYYEGVQVVILPKDDVKLPKDTPKDFSKVNMHLLLGDFTYKNGTVTTVTPNESRIKYIDADRLSDTDKLLSDKYVSRSNLDPNQIYTYVGRPHPDSGQGEWKDYWLGSTDSLMVWDDDPTLDVNYQPSTEANFQYNESTGEVNLVMPHKQFDSMVDDSGRRVWFRDKVLSLPVADFGKGTGGTVNKEYTDRIKKIESKIDRLYHLPNGKMRAFIDVLSDRNDLPKIPLAHPGDWPVTSLEIASTVNLLETKVSDMQSVVEALVSGLDSKIDSKIDAKLADYYEQTIKVELTTVSDSLAGIEADLKDLSRRVDKLEISSSEESEEQQIRQLQEAVTQIQNDLESINKKLDGTNPSTDPGIIRKLNKLITDFDNYKSETLETLRTDLNRQVAEAISTIETRYAEIYNEFDRNVKQRLSDYDNAFRNLVIKYHVSDEWVWEPGDYVVVREDRTVEAAVEGRYPSTIYVVAPGWIRNITNVGTIATQISYSSGRQSNSYLSARDVMLRSAPSKLTGGIELDSIELTADQFANTSGNDAITYGAFWDITSYRGTLYRDYFVARYMQDDEDTQIETWFCTYYTPSMLADRYQYHDPIWITGGTPFATEESIGGFVNVPADRYGEGYVRLNDQGYLQLIDYELLLTGVLAYQLGEDRKEGSGLSLEDIQGNLEEYVNDRVVFPNQNKRNDAEEKSEDPNVIHLTLELPKSDEGGIIYLHDIGSRYGSSLYLHIKGSAASNTYIYIQNCDKLRIDCNMDDSAPTILLSRVHLYYDAEVLDKVSMIENLTLWYERYEETDPNLSVDGMTVTLLDEMVTTESFNPWSSLYQNDNQYIYGLRSVTFGPDGSIVGVGLLVGDHITANNDLGKSVFYAGFRLPQTVGLPYPVTRLTRRLKVTGTFVTHYVHQDETGGFDGYVMKETSFTALTNAYNAEEYGKELNALQNFGTGSIAFYSDVDLVSAIYSGTDQDEQEMPEGISCWRSGQLHLFYGGAID